MRERASGPVGRDLTRWLTESSRFRAFVDRYRAKIGHKARSATTRDALLDLRAELAAAERLLLDRRIDLEYEPYGSGQRGPDFAVTYGSARLTLEVTRPRRYVDATDARRAIVAKLRQLPPSVPNALLLAVEPASAATGPVDIAEVIRNMRRDADVADADLLRRAGVDTTRAFYDRFLRLGAVIVWADVTGRCDLWTNPSARIAVPGRAATAIVAAIRGNTP